MAKKVVATLQGGKEKKAVKVIKMIRSSKTNAYEFKEGMVNLENVKKFLEEK
ncbi:MAG: DUF4295 domain-containing protein [Bacteroidota bacterium]